MTITTSMWPSEITAALAEVNTLVQPWLGATDEWRKDSWGMPLPDDMAIALARLRRQQRPNLSLEFHWVDLDCVYVSSPGWGNDEFEGETMASALLLMLQDALRRACRECGEWDGHNVRCAQVAC